MSLTSSGIGPCAFITQPDGARTAYEILGGQHLGLADPIVLVGGATSLRGDLERLAVSLARIRPVLLFDHRGMGDSTLSTAGDEDITIELMTRDLLYLLQVLEWKKLSICGFSMGGVITQQLLFLPFHPTNPISLPFKVTHAFLTGTLTGPLKDPRYGLKLAKAPPPNLGRKRTRLEKRDIARPTLESTFDPKWVSDPANAERFEWWLERMTFGRPMRTIAMQARALQSIQFDELGYYDKLLQGPTRILVIHGKLDEVVPFSCASDIIQRIPWAEFVEVGSRAGQIPHLDFGHQWFEYFDAQVWHDVIVEFLKSPSVRPVSGCAKL